MTSVRDSVFSEIVFKERFVLNFWFRYSNLFQWALQPPLHASFISVTSDASLLSAAISLRFITSIYQIQFELTSASEQLL